MATEVAIAGRLIGPTHPPYIIAELSANHGGSLEHALKVMERAARAGADAVKLQTYTPDTLTINHDGQDFTIRGGPWDGRSLYELYEEAHTPWEWHAALFAKGRELGITVFSSPFDHTAVDFLEAFDPPAFKIASFELIDHALIERVARTGKPTIMSTGMASTHEIKEAVEAFVSGGGREFMLLHCISGYPTPIEQANLRRIPALAAIHDCPVGLSDHTLGTEAAIAAVALGANIIEKHFTLRRADGGPDAAFSLEPAELEVLINSAGAVFSALGSGSDQRSEVESESRIFRRSIYVVRDIGPGETLSRDNIRVIRPGYGLPPKELPKLLGRRSRKAIKRGTALRWDLVE